ncbi:hypothetical protein AALO_G00222370 [Alosa alosa]|uniref:Uncharacterized protein n=1 Tax=Alosa alosa TaxID=278164 RepID=A0AAV6FXE4_9TELE|nr:uncharacterized protein LOC121697759 [Alosa sapidissima]XP_048124463.1 uncharacterized protein LOC125310790 [Alosa alosa]KAG5267494.1 hypothetical protein AALO_G00222370 [Alosa alosa]
MYPHTLTQLDRWNPFSAPFTDMHQNEQPAPEEAHPKRKLPSVDDACLSDGECGAFVHWSEEVQWFDDQHEEKKDGTVSNGVKATWNNTRILTRAMVANGNGIHKALGRQNLAKEMMPNGVHIPAGFKHWIPLWAKVAAFLFFGVLTGCLLYIFQPDDFVPPPLQEEETEELEDTIMFTWEWISIMVAETVAEFVFITKSLFSFF